MTDDDPSEEEDWFEKALAEDDATDDERSEGGPEDDAGPEPSDGKGDRSPFGDDGGETSSDGPFSGEGSQNPFDDGNDQSPFGDAGGETSTDGPFGDDSGELFDESFGSAFESGSEEFEDAEFESDIPRVDLGIEGLDSMIQGGIPEHHLMTVVGSAGTGKTTFGLQFLYHGLQNDQKGVFITLEQSRESIVSTANEWGWDFDAYEDDGDLVVVDLDPVEMANSLDNIQSELPELIEEFGADRLVLDSVSLLEMMYDEPAKRRTEVFDFTRSLKDAGVTTFLTSEASESNPYASRHGIIEYLTDAVFILQYVRGDARETRLAVEIQKIRNANHSRAMKPYDITDEGLSVYDQANIF